MSEVSPELVYWVTRLDHIRTLLGWLSAVTVVTSIAACIFAAVTQACDDEIRELKKDFHSTVRLIHDKERVAQNLEYLKETAESINGLEHFVKKSLQIAMFAIIGFFTLFAGCSFVPNTKEACAILVIPQVANSNVVQQELPKSIESIVKIANNYLEEKLATPTKKGGEK